jgi:hypothetical protein
MNLNMDFLILLPNIYIGQLNQQSTNDSHSTLINNINHVIKYLATKQDSLKNELSNFLIMSVQQLSFETKNNSSETKTLLVGGDINNATTLTTPLVPDSTIAYKPTDNTSVRITNRVRNVPNITSVITLHMEYIMPINIVNSIVGNTRETDIFNNLQSVSKKINATLMKGPDFSTANEILTEFIPISLENGDIDNIPTAKTRNAYINSLYGAKSSKFILYIYKCANSKFIF